MAQRTHGPQVVATNDSTVKGSFWPFRTSGCHFGIPRAAGALWSWQHREWVIEDGRRQDLVWPFRPASSGPHVRESRALFWGRQHTPSPSRTRRASTGRSWRSIGSAKGSSSKRGLPLTGRSPSARRHRGIAVGHTVLHWSDIDPEGTWNHQAGGGKADPAPSPVEETG